jgi:hypothetical protein
MAGFLLIFYSDCSKFGTDEMLSGYILTPEDWRKYYRIGMIMKMMNYRHTGVETIKTTIRGGFLYIQVVQIFCN